MRFTIVTPVLNGERFINETILSVVGQAGDFTIRYHVQDAGSTDSTLKLLAAWQHRLANDFPLNCAGIEFSFASAPDRGLYDGVNRGFAACGDADAMAWINADDRYEAGAFATVAQIFKGHPDIDWVMGRPTTINEGGEMLDISPLTAFPRECIAAGIFDGRFARPFIQQEGTFWRPELWKKTGGLDANFRFAGDFDLWRRFAARSDLVVVNAILGCFRFRSGQLSSDMTRYREEIDSSLSPREKETRSRASTRYAKAGFSYRILRRHYDGPWICERWPMCALPFLGARAFWAEHWRISFLGPFN
ncbi:glycosyltransferase [Methylocapsa palsarum]|uniref:Glycosyltransferase involved in cell wall bisynthesis n=1 Tax=Methylocapsa palsarum TaxID=1612308 RepID=A0A1I3WTF5_9HYPH|nr:glycosyltransferase [Methylocapsa palsarum]SFK10924.1 Glycosyltransferase involved in cell wall bisynthesis [Methylocapsa palsarum]